MKLALLIVLVLVSLAALAAGQKFPSNNSSRSPDSKWKLICKSPGNGAAEYNHRLLLLGTDGSSRELRQFDRSCDILWSADSSHVAVTDWLASDMSDIFIYTVTNSQSGTSLGDLFPKDALPQAEMHGHCYYEAMKWLDGHRLRIRIFGHTDESPSHEFEHIFVFDLSSQRFEKLTAKTPNKSLQATATARSVLTAP